MNSWFFWAQCGYWLKTTDVNGYIINLYYHNLWSKSQKRKKLKGLNSIRNFNGFLVLLYDYTLNLVEIHILIGIYDSFMEILWTITNFMELNTNFPPIAWFGKNVLCKSWWKKYFQKCNLFNKTEMRRILNLFKKEIVDLEDLKVS